MAHVHPGHAGLGARRPSTPLTDCTVDRAVICVALGGLHQGRASVATMLGMSSNHASTALGASSACFTALAPGRPHRNFAVNRARTSITSPDVRLRRTSYTTVGRINENIPKTFLSASSACCRTQSVRTPIGHDTVDGAELDVATLDLIQGTAANAAEGRATTDRSCPLLGTMATAFRARTESTPCSKEAVDWAGRSVADLAFSQSRALGTAICSGGFHGSSAHLRTRTTTLCAVKVLGSKPPSG